jgi:hypothetical protein
MSETTSTLIPKRKERGMRLSKTLREEFYEFVVNTSVSRMNRLLRDFLLAYLKDDPDGAEEFFKSETYFDLTMIFHLLDTIEEEYTEEE